MSAKTSSAAALCHGPFRPINQVYILAPRLKVTTRCSFSAGWDCKRCLNNSLWRRRAAWFPVLAGNLMCGGSKTHRCGHIALPEKSRLSLGVSRRVVQPPPMSGLERVGAWRSPVGHRRGGASEALPALSTPILGATRTHQPVPICTVPTYRPGEGLVFRRQDALVGRVHRCMSQGVNPAPLRCASLRDQWGVTPRGHALSPRPRPSGAEAGESRRKEGRDMEASLSLVLTGVGLLTAAVTFATAIVQLRTAQTKHEKSRRCAGTPRRDRRRNNT